MSSRLTADIVLISGKIITINDDFLVAQALAIKNGRFLAVGRNEEIESFIHKNTEVINLDGRVVVPGFIDSHLHMAWTGLNSKKINLRGIRSIDHLLKAVEKKAEEKSEGGWVQGFGWDEGYFNERQYPTRWDLDKVSHGHPIHLARAYGHIEVVNSKGLQLAGITKDTHQPNGGSILRDPVTGEPTGVLSGQGALALIEKILPPSNIEEKKEAIRVISREFSAGGITSICDGWLYPEDFRLFQELNEAGELTVRVCGMVKVDAGIKTLNECLDYIEAWGPSTNFGNDMLKIGGLKLVLDGGIGGKTALSRLPYVDEIGSFGLQVIPSSDLVEICKLGAKNNWQVGVHCCGGKAIDLTVEAYKQVNKEIPVKDRRWMLIHAYEPSEHTFADCKKLGLVVAAQPVFIHLMGHSFLSGWDKERASYACPLRDWLDHRIHVGGGSDSPMATFEPLVGVWAAVNRRIELTGELLGGDQRVSLEEALRMFTIESAYLSFDEKLKGSIEPGKLADLVILEEDILHIPKMDIANIPISMTIMGGCVVYRKG